MLKSDASSRIRSHGPAEYADVTETLLKPYGSFNLAQTLNDPAFKPYIRSLSVCDCSLDLRPNINSQSLQITDQPRERPLLPIPPDQRERHVILSLRVPPSSQAEVTIPLVKAMFTLIDNLETKVTLRPETRSKLRKTREELDAKIKKEAEAEKREEVGQLQLLREDFNSPFLIRRRRTNWQLRRRLRTNAYLASVLLSSRRSSNAKRSERCESRRPESKKNDDSYLA